ncbi:putative tetratricopeptide-like helical domain-containing protein [Rosa chinensis]|uniref:Putative tetratricopeptide-like helical domain-containing protein n=1 Tax=Rosa chinensis TaxID=74649 RepID=A0A2P6PS45_ROSCH|nr:pentatricopeptide repeat-containing protein At2g20710, mitochondrial [Rosa chinensis]PRQ24755.1 putative tetratricopeptide-like helical domain-containing protein [Rosa chinensis]
MTNLLRSNPWRGNAISRVFGALFYSTNALASPPPPLQSLHRRICWLQDQDLKASIFPILSHWAAEARDVNQLEVQAFIVKLRKSNHFNHALQVSTWMSDELKLSLTPGDVAARIDLISRVHGPDEAEKYFDGVSEQLKGLQAYCALLHCYAQHRLLDKAESVFGKMKELGFEIGIRSYNSMLWLCFRTGNHGRIDVLVKEMEEKGIDYNQGTLMVRLYSYAAISEIGRMEEVLLKMEAHPLVTISWRSYVIAANALSKVGEVDKALTLLRSSEKLISNSTRKIAYEHLLSSYAAIGKRDEVDRISNLYKNLGKCYSYRHMLVAFLKMDNIDGAEKLVEECESESKKFDIQIGNLMVNAYCKKGYLERAKSFVEKLAESGKENVSTWCLLSKGYYRNGCVAEALQAIKKAANLPCQPGWRFNHSTLAACLVYLKENGDVETAHELLSLLTEKGHITTIFCETLKSFVNGETQVLRSIGGEQENHLEDKIQDGELETMDSGAQQCG